MGPRPVGDDPYFCCSGCAVVYEALHDAGFDDTFYRLRDLTPDARDPQPAQPRVDPLHLSELDAPAFLEEHTEDLGDGLREIELFLDGVHCAACVWLVERLPYELDGVVEARLDLPRARLTLQFDPDHVKLSDVARWLARFGYQAHPSRAEGLAQRSDVEHRLLIKTGVCWALAGNVMLLAFALYAGLNLADDPTMAAGARWTSLALATVSVLYGGSEFLKRAWASPCGRGSCGACTWTRPSPSASSSATATAPGPPSAARATSGSTPSRCSSRRCLRPAGSNSAAAASRATPRTASSPSSHRWRGDACPTAATRSSGSTRSCRAIPSKSRRAR
ncbi:MAG: hypothetical protein GVY18_13355 [Bacteroidetes bacterium]|nr:hypothetical protein [Bacteroidota bacterium]